LATFAQLAAVLPCHAHRVRALLGKATVIDNPIRHRPVPLDRRQHLRPYRGQQRRIVPLGLRHHMVQRLVLGLHMGRIEPGGHRLDALTLARQQQTGAVSPRRGGSACVTQAPDNGIQIRRQAGLACQRLSCSSLIHKPYMGWLWPIARGK
jgi:hypothetical protein